LFLVVLDFPVAPASLVALCFLDTLDILEDLDFLDTLDILGDLDFLDTLDVLEDIDYLVVPFFLVVLLPQQASLELILKS
jgi:hypothetical protein